jgi:integrase
MRRTSVRHKGIPKIERLKATKRLPQRYKVRWDRGTKSFTDTDRAEVLRFTADLVANDYIDPREDGRLYGKEARAAKRKAAAASKEDRSFRTVAERYLDVLDATPGYVQRYRGHLKNHAYPVIGDMHVRDIRVEDVESVAIRCKLAPSTRSRLVSGLISPIFDYAIDREWRERGNPCRAVAKLINAKPVRQPTLELADAPMFLEHCRSVSELVGDFATLLYGTGYRWQEASCLKVSSVHLLQRKLTISAVEREAASGVEVAIDRGKSDAGFRDSPLPALDDDPLIAMLTRRTQDRDGDEWLFSTQKGRRIYYDVIQDGLEEARAIALAEDGYDVHITPHGLRRGFSQAVHDRGATGDQVKLLLGHVRLTGATARYAVERLTPAHIHELQPLIADLTWRRSHGENAEQRFKKAILAPA